MRKYKSTKHRGPLSLLGKMFGVKGKDLKGSTMSFHPLSHEPGEWAMDDIIAELKEFGMYAFCRTSVNNKGPYEIHWWAEEWRSPEDVILMLGHEMGHGNGPQLEDHDEEEDRADLYGMVAREAFRLQCRHSRDRAGQRTSPKASGQKDRSSRRRRR